MKVTKKQIIEAIGTINIFFPHNKYDITKELVEGWMSFFGDYEQELFAKSLRRAIANSQFVPTIGAITAEAKKLVAAGMPSGETVWQRLMEAFPARRSKYTEYGYEYNYSACDKEVASLLPPVAVEAFGAIGGWDEIAKASADELEWVRKRFAKEYAERSAAEIEKVIDGTNPQLATSEKPALTDGGQDGRPQAAAASLAERWRN